MQVIDAFKQVIDQEITIVDQLIKLGLEKREIINSPARLQELVNQEVMLLADLERAEQERFKLFDVIAPGQKLKEWLNSTSQPEITTQISRLEAKVDELTQINQLNQQLIAESLAFIQNSLNLLTDDLPLTYTKPGTRKQTISIIDRKV